MKLSNSGADDGVKRPHHLKEFISYIKRVYFKEILEIN
jgi:hypothetical protein